MDKTTLLEPTRWLSHWWALPGRGRGKVILVPENRPAGGGHPSSHVEWPRLMLCLAGERRYRDGAGGTFRMQAGEALYFAPGRWISPLVSRRPFRSLGVHWEAGQARLILREGNPLDPPRVVWSIPLPPETDRRLGERLDRLFGSSPHTAEAVLLLEVGRLLDELARGRKRIGPGRRRALYLRVAAYLEEQSGRPHTRESVAARFGISPGHLTRLFREEGGGGFTEFLNLLRLREAERLLSTTALTVQEVALQTGFTDAGYFSRRFRQRYGIPPGKVGGAEKGSR